MIIIVLKNGLELMVFVRVVVYLLSKMVILVNLFLCFISFLLIVCNWVSIWLRLGLFVIRLDIWVDVFDMLVSRMCSVWLCCLNVVSSVLVFISSLLICLLWLLSMCVILLVFVSSCLICLLCWLMVLENVLIFLRVVFRCGVV